MEFWAENDMRSKVNTYLRKVESYIDNRKGPLACCTKRDQPLVVHSDSDTIVQFG